MARGSNPPNPGYEVATAVWITNGKSSSSVSDLCEEFQVY